MISEKVLNIEFLNYKKSSNSLSNFSINLNKQKDIIKINELNFNEKDNVIKLKNIHLKNNKLFSFDELSVKTNNNNFFIKNDKKILIKGSKFDATNLAKYLNRQSKENFFKK